MAAERVRAFMLVNPNCACGRLLNVPRPFLPDDPPVNVTCDCGRTSLCSLNLDWFVEQAVKEALEKLPLVIGPTYRGRSQG